MNKLVILICFLVADILTVGAQTSEVSDKQKGKYFEYTILEKSRGLNHYLQFQFMKILK